jgi:hypothetical protein
MQNRSFPRLARNLLRASARIVFATRFFSFLLSASFLGLILIVHIELKTRAETIVPFHHTIWRDDAAFPVGLTARLKPILAKASQPERTISSSDVGTPVLLIDESSGRALALNSVTGVTEPFSVTEPIAFGQDDRTRVMMFAKNVALEPGETASSVTANAEDRQNRLYNLTVEYVSYLSLPDSISVVIIRLSDDMTNDIGDVAVRLHYHGMTSNDAYMAIGINGPMPTPTPTPIPTPTPTPTPTPSPAANTIYVAANGLPGNSGTANSPIDLATAVSASGPVRPGYTVQLSAGIYRYASLTFAPGGTSPGVMTIFKAAPGARVIITSPANTPPNIFMRDYTRLDGLWIGGTKLSSDTADIFLGGSPISHWKQIVNCTIFGYYGGIVSGSSEYALIQGNRFVHNGGGTLYHAVYISGAANWPPAPGTLTQHTIVDNNVFIAGPGDGGYGIHFFHNNRSGIATRNFVTYQWGLVMDGSDHLAANNLFWRCGKHDASNLALTWIYASNTRVQNNILGPLDYLMKNSDTTNTISKNAFESSPSGANAITLTSGQEAAQIGLSAATIDSAIATLNTAFSRTVDNIFADSTIEPAFATIKGITVPVGSPLYRTGLPWFDSNPINVGPNSGSPASIAAFWQAFRALGLKEYDSNGNIMP